MSIKLLSIEQWKAICPRCRKTAYTNDEMACDNCHSASWFKYPFGKKSGFQSDEAYFSWYGIYCSKECGWNINELKCPDCDASIRGKYICAKSPGRHFLWTLFSFTSAFLVLGILFLGGLLFLFWLGAN